MAQLFSKYWYLDEPVIRRAFLCNARDNDLQPGGTIRRGEIVVGQCGFSAAENDVTGFKGKITDYLPNRCVEWQKHYLTCMALEGLPAGARLKSQRKTLRHKHYVVAEVTTARLQAHARKIGLRVVHSPRDGRALVNLEIFTVPGRTPDHRRAKLL